MRLRSPSGFEEGKDTHDHLDLVERYPTQAEVGAALAGGTRDRKSFFVVSKLWSTVHAPSHLGSSVVLNSYKLR